MSLQHTFDSLLTKGRAKLNEFTNQQHHPSQSQQSQQSHSNYPGSPPPIPYSSRPSPPSQTYWAPSFHPSIPISQLFQQETGAHGWGNNESQNYTDRPTNCFFTPNNQLVLRATANSSSPADKYTSARLVSHQKLSRPRGYLSATLTAPCASGIWPAFWLLPSQPFNWPTDGEVDILESWNGDCRNHSCLHWGNYNGEDWNKHRVVETHVPDMPRRPIRAGFAWVQDRDEDGAPGKLIWYLDGRAVMKANIPPGTRRMSDWNIIMNVAMGGNVCGGQLPADGSYDFVVQDLVMAEEPPGGWSGFETAYTKTGEGKTL